MDKDILKTAVVLRHRLHRCAELSGQEKQTKAMLIDFLRTHTSLELHDMGAAFMKLCAPFMPRVCVTS